MIPVKDKYQLRNWELVSVNPNNRDWNWFDFFNFWAVSIQSIIGFSLIASLYLLYDLNSLVVLSGTLFAGLIVFFLSNLIGSISQSSGLPFPVILRLSMGFSGARYLGLIRALIGIFMFGVQTFFISKSLGYIFRIILFKIDSQLLNHEILLIFFFGLNAIDFLSLILCLITQFILFTKRAGFNKNFIKFSSITIYLGLIIFLIIIISENYVALISSLILSTNIENFISRNNIFPFMSVVGTMFAYFSILLLNFGDFARYAKNKSEMNKGNFSLLLNLVIFSALALLICLGSDIILAQKSISVERLLTNPNDIIGKINNNYLTIISLMFILISSVSSNLIANYIPSQNTLINFLPNSLNLKSSGAVIILLALFVSFFWLSIFSQGLSLSVFDTLASFLGPIFGVIVADFYIVQNKKINHKELFYPEETTIYIYNSGWNLKALYSVIIGFIFSAATIWNINLLSLQSFGWLIGALVSYILYLLLKKIMHDFDLNKKTAIITGGAQGFGLDIAKRFINSGCKVRIWDIDETELKKASNEINSDKLNYDVVDVSNFTQVKNTAGKIAENSNIDILINSAGITGPTAELWNYEINEWLKIIEINLHGTFYCCKAVIPYMIKNNYGRIVNIASVSGKDGNANASAYSSSKAGVIGLTKSLGKELALNNIAVNAVTPAGANTRILNQMSKEHVQRMLSKVPKGRFLEVHELTSMVCWLSSEENSFSTAAVFDISGGRSTY